MAGKRERDDFKLNGGKTNRNESVGFEYTILDIFEVSESS